MGQADYLELGTWNAQCYRCGAKRKANTLVKQWQGYYVCPEHFEPRQPQDFVRGVPDRPNVPWDQPQSIVFVGPAVLLCTVSGRSAVAGYAVAGCAIAGNPNFGSVP